MPHTDGFAHAHRVGCPECDLLVELPPPEPGAMARCPRCRFVLSRGMVDGFRRPLAYALTALILMIIAASTPFLAVSAAGLSNDITLVTAVTSLTRFDADAIAVLVLAFVLVVPGLLMVAVASLTLLLEAGRPHRLLVPLGRLLFHLDAWSMADVFAVGVIVSLVKLATMADVVLGAAFWAYLGFTMFAMLALTRLDRVSVWAAIDSLRSRP